MSRQTTQTMRTKEELERLGKLAEEVPFSHKKVLARLILVIEYDETPDRAELDEIIEKCRERGGVELAEYHHVAPTRESLI